MFDKIEYGIISCEDAAYPTIVRLGNKDLICAYSIGGGPNISGGTHWSRSTDEGKIWEYEGVILPRQELPEVAANSLRLSRTKNGQLVAYGQKKYINNGTKFGRCKNEPVFCIADEHSLEWSEARIIPHNFGCPVEISNPICELEDGRWLAPAALLSNPERLGEKVIVWESKDKGKSWNNYYTALVDLGYCENTGCWTQNNISFTEMPIDKARETIFDLFKEFRFLEIDVDRSIAVAYLITPALRYFLRDERAPIFFADGNRPGVGKDCLLRTVPLLYTGIASDQSPCSSDAEWKKVINSACFKAAEFLIITNLKNHLDSKALEGASTSSNLEGRVLGESTLRTISNNAIYAFSGNGVTFSSDLDRRYIRIRLEVDDEDIQEVTYTRNLPEYIRSNNTLLISAVYSCVKHWVENGMPDGNGRMISFDQWARKVTGVMELCNLGNPFQKRTKITDSMKGGGDQKTPHMKELVKSWAEEYGDKEINAESLRELVKLNDLFPWMKLNEHSGKTLFSKMIVEHSGRIFAGYRIIIDKDRKRTAYRLEHVPSKKVVMHVNHHNEACMPEVELPIDTEALIATNPEVPADLVESTEIPEEELELMAEEDSVS